MNHAEYLCHSSGPWKKHKYFQKIGEGANAVYRYSKKAGEAVEDAVDNARWDAEEKSAEIADKLYEKSGMKARDRWQKEESMLNSARDLDKAWKEGDKKWWNDEYAQKRSTREKANELKAIKRRNQQQAEIIKEYRATARGAKQIYDQTAMGKAESALNKAKNRVAKAKKKLKHDGMYSSEYLSHADEVARGQAKIDALFGR